MNKLKISLALIALIIPLLLCAKKRNIEFIKHGNHRIPVESFIPVKAFFDDCNKELTIEFAQDWEAVTIEIKHWKIRKKRLVSASRFPTSLMSPI